MRVLVWLGMVLWSLPWFTQAAVLINEIAWMGNETSANNEWIELYNTDATAVSLDSWSLSDGMNLDIALVGTIAAGGYAVLERTDEDSAPGSAFLIYTGALPNTGATLSLYDSAGSLEDQVAGGENWELIGGDNVTKETAQYTTSGWITAESTPGAANSTIDNGSGGENEEDSQATETEEGGNQKKQVTTPKPNDPLGLTLSLPPVIYVNQSVDFVAMPTGQGETVRNSLEYDWNFGDLNVAKGREVSHAYTQPGEYIVSVQAEYSIYQSELRQAVTVLPITLSLTETEDSLLVHNDSPYEVDLSGYTLYGTKPLQFPPRTYLLPRATLVVEKGHVRPADFVLTKLYDEANVMVASTNKTNHEVSEAPIARPAVLSAVSGDELVSSSPIFEPQVEELDTPTSPKATSVVLQAPITSDNHNANNGRLAYVGLLTILMGGILGVYATKRS